MPQISERVVGTGAAARAPVPRQRPAARRVGGRPAKPARRDNVDEFLRVANERIYTLTPVVRGLLDLRLLIGRLFGWDSPRPSTQAAPRTTIAWLCDRILY